MASKDLRLTLGRGSGLVQAMLLGLLLIFVFSLSLTPGERMSAQGAAAVFWMASAFCQVLIFSTLYSYEERNGQRQALLLAPIPVQGVWLGKAVAGLMLLLAAQALFLPAAVVFLDQTITSAWPLGLGLLMLADIGVVMAGSLLGAVSQGHSAKESLLSIILFPLLAPLLLSGISIGAAVFSGIPPLDAPEWFGLALAFDAIFAGSALILFPHMYNAEE